MRKPVNRTLAAHIANQLLEYSKQFQAQFSEIPAQIDEPFQFPKHFLPIRKDLKQYVDVVNAQIF